MESLVLLPYCPLPVDSGAKVEMWKHLDILNRLGSCCIVSARRRPVGVGWKPEYISEIRSRGFKLIFREDSTRISLMQGFGYLYGVLCKALRLDRAFGHSNPYHRYAFPGKWWYDLSRKSDLAVIHYSFWAYLPSVCPKVIVLHDLISGVSWEGESREIRELQSADLVIVISKDEEVLLNRRGVTRTLWSPPSVRARTFSRSNGIGLVGSANRFNIEGLEWLDKGKSYPDLKVHIYGKLSRHVPSNRFIPMGPYTDPHQPYKECGIILLVTAMGTGVQIKAIEALACGRAIIARKGAMRGIPYEDQAWIEVDSPEEMLKWAKRLTADELLRNKWSLRAKAYYKKHLEYNNLINSLRNAYVRLSA